jgi:hypothetical protein
MTKTAFRRFELFASHSNVVRKRTACFTEVFRASVTSDSMFSEMSEGLLREFFAVLIPNISVDVTDYNFDDIFTFRALCKIEILYQFL